ncbi:hypothetical protein [Citrobacter sp. Cpo107]|uniref:hypothetical protein n=1 Tax=Citrobacter TaxID=544 RepID=UPI0025765D3B|nr:hypothetical protein [Citrobacter sp. Cpo107]MDM2807630.1 hypothetical protein [Citrobacter sp. Cpo107]
MIETTVNRIADPVRLSAYFQRCEKFGEVYRITDEATGIECGLISRSKLEWLESRSAELRQHEDAERARHRIPKRIEQQRKAADTN